MQARITTASDRKFNPAWLTEKEFQGWLDKRLDHNDGIVYPWCLACSVSIGNKKSSITAHSTAKKHIDNIASIETKKKQQELLRVAMNTPANPVRDQVTKLEVRFMLVAAEKILLLAILVLIWIRLRKNFQITISSVKPLWEKLKRQIL